MSVLNLIRSELLENPASSTTGAIGHRLHANELPWAAIRTASPDLNLYPESALKEQVQNQLAQRYQIEPTQITLTRGSDDGIDLLMRLFLTAQQDAIMQFPPTFPMYAFYARLQQAHILECPLDESNNFNLCMERLNENWQSHCKLIMLCNPNNPTGNLINLEWIAQLCRCYANRSVIIVDEAYMEFANGQSAAALIPQFDNLIVLRTLSKAYGLAGLRLGAILAQPQVIDALNGIMAPYPIPSVVLHLAKQALSNEDWFAAALTKIKIARTKLMDELRSNSLMEKIYPSEANFILVKTPYSQEIASGLNDQGITIRSFPKHTMLEHHLRITVGSEQQNLLLTAALSSFQNRFSGF